MKYNKIVLAVGNGYLGSPAPPWLLEIGAKVIGTETELILKSRWVLAQRLLDSGYTFLFSKAEHAVKDLLNSRN